MNQSQPSDMPEFELSDRWLIPVPLACESVPASPAAEGAEPLPFLESEFDVVSFEYQPRLRLSDAA